MAGVDARRSRRGRGGVGGAARRHARPTPCAPSSSIDWRTTRCPAGLPWSTPSRATRAARSSSPSSRLESTRSDSELLHVDGRGDRESPSPDAQPAGPPQPPDAALHPRAAPGGPGGGGRYGDERHHHPQHREVVLVGLRVHRRGHRSRRLHPARGDRRRRVGHARPGRRVGPHLELRAARHRAGAGELPGRRHRSRPALRPGRRGRGRQHRLPPGALHGRPAHQHVALPPGPAVDEAARADR